MAFEGLKETPEQSCNKCKWASFYSKDGKRDFPACKLYGLGKGSYMNCEDFEPMEDVSEATFEHYLGRVINESNGINDTYYLNNNQIKSLRSIKTSLGQIISDVNYILDDGNDNEKVLKLGELISDFEILVNTMLQDNL